MKHIIFISFIIIECAVLSVMLLAGHVSMDERIEEVAAKKSIVKSLMLTDLSLWTEARYTRHPSQADLFAPFQDFPGAIDHFPASSILAPPDAVRPATKLIIKDRVQSGS